MVRAVPASPAAFHRRTMPSVAVVAALSIFTNFCSGLALGGSTKAPSLRKSRLSEATNGERKLLPSPPLHHEHKSKSVTYQGCFGLSSEELSSAWIFEGDHMPPCTVEVQGKVVIGEGGSGGESGGGSSELSGASATGSSGNAVGSSGSNVGSNGDSSVSAYEAIGTYGGSSSNSGVSGSSYSGGSDGSSSNTWNGYRSESGGSESYYPENASVEAAASVPPPLRYFNISDCLSYSNYWMWDLALSCENLTSLFTCECTAASVLHDIGELDCPGVSGSPSCPEKCPVCNTCMKLLSPKMGCSDKDIENEQRLPSSSLEQEFRSSLPLAIGVAAAVASLVLGATVYQYKKSNAQNGPLGTEFIRQEQPPVSPLL